MMRGMVWKLIQAGAIIACLSGAASAQVMFSPFKAQENKRPPTQEEIDRQRALDNAYKSATTKIPEKKVDDPWATVRPTPPVSPQGKKQQ